MTKSKMLSALALMAITASVAAATASNSAADPMGSQGNNSFICADHTMSMQQAMLHNNIARLYLYYPNGQLYESLTGYGVRHYIGGSYLPAGMAHTTCWTALKNQALKGNNCMEIRYPIKAGKPDGSNTNNCPAPRSVFFQGVHWKEHIYYATLLPAMPPVAPLAPATVQAP